jgi:hypothetical protein
MDVLGPSVDARFMSGHPGKQFRFESSRSLIASGDELMPGLRNSAGRSARSLLREVLDIGGEGPLITRTPDIRREPLGRFMR